MKNSISSLKVFILITISIIIISVLYSFIHKNIYDNGNTPTPHSETRNITDFNAVSVSTGIEVELTQSDKEYIIVESSNAEYINNIITKVNNNETLEIYIKGSVKNTRIKLHVYFVDIKKIDVSAGASINGKLSVPSLDIELTSGADINFNGNTQSLNLDISSGASFKGYDFICDSVNVNISSGGTAKLTASELPTHAKAMGWASGFNGCAT